MMRFFYGGRNFLAGQDAVTLLLDYSAALARARSADVVQLRTVDPDGTVEEVSLVVGAGIPIVGETSHAVGPGPANALVIDYMTRELERLRRQQPPTD
ncbi:hypothetical protein [Naasia sp. SYSU D00057]|uniref:hypothetical protein n=1 Tax=Naasia sp. SYSU D00057 TaxID=2817380 RepID=UPI001B30D618|nr:hypothetical protein [Naasia sp. SYSU D00057]